MWRQIRSAAERLSRGVVIRRRLPARFDRLPVHVSPDSSLRYWWRSVGSAEADLLAWVDELVQPAGVVWDVGANVGVFGLAASCRAGAAGSVLLVEPDPWLAGLIERSAASLPKQAARAEVLALALAECAGTARFRIAARGRASNHLAAVEGSTQAGGSREEIVVPTESLDGLLAGRRAPTVVKIDVEGAELDVLAGGRDLLSRVRPLLLCEVDERNDDAVGRLLHSYDYDLLDATLPVSRRVPLELPVFNTLAVPAERSPLGAVATARSSG